MRGLSPDRPKRGVSLSRRQSDKKRAVRWILSVAATAAVAVPETIMIACGSSGDAGTPVSIAGDAQAVDQGVIGLGDAETADGGAIGLEAGGDAQGASPELEAGYTRIQLNNAFCLPDQLPAVGGMASCRVLLDDVEGGCAAPSLAQSPPGDITAIDALLRAQAQPPLQGALCVLMQMGPGTSAMGVTECQNEQQSGWCYVEGSCVAHAARMCAQDLCITTAFLDAGIAYGGVWLACP